MKTLMQATHTHTHTHRHTLDLLNFGISVIPERDVAPW